MAQTVKVWLDKNFLQTTKGSGELLTNFEKNNIQTIIENLPIENSIFWTRVVDNGSSKAAAKVVSEESEVQHDHILVKMELDVLCAFATDYYDNSSTLFDHIAFIKSKAQVTKCTLLIQGFKQFMKDLKITKQDAREEQNYNNLIKKKANSKPKANGSGRKFSKSEMNNLLIDLELSESVCVRSYETNDELRDLIMCYTKSVSEYEMKQDDNNILFCEQKGEKSQIKTASGNNKEYSGLINVWKDILECFPLVSSDQAQAIVTSYPSPLLLKHAFDDALKQRSEKEAKLLLADIQVRRGAGVLTSVRRIGPELSQKVFKFFTSINANELLVNTE